jgi:RNA polymerase sigma-70 factor (ECF subfamily)
MPTNAIALTRLLVRERPSLLRLAERILRDRPAAEDVTQSLWLRVQRIEDDPPILNKRAYLFRLAANLATDRVRANRRYRALIQTTDTPPEDVPAEFASADVQMVARETLDRMMCAIDELSPRAREIFILRKIDELPLEEVSQRVGISRSMVVRYLQQALRHCMKRCAEDE